MSGDNMTIHDQYKKNIEELNNMVFPSKEDEDTIEHIDCGYEEFMNRDKKLYTSFIKSEIERLKGEFGEGKQFGEDFEEGYDEAIQSQIDYLTKQLKLITNE